MRCPCGVLSKRAGPTRPFVRVRASAVWSHGRDRIVGTGSGWRTLVYDAETGALLHTLNTPAAHLGAAASSSRVQAERGREGGREREREREGEREGER